MYRKPLNCTLKWVNINYILNFIYLFIYGCVGSSFLCEGFRQLRQAGASGGHSSPRCAGLSLSRPLLLRSTGSRRAGSVVVAHGPSRSAACGIFPDQDSNPCPLHWQADSQPLRHQGSPARNFISRFCKTRNLRRTKILRTQNSRGTRESLISDNQ